MKPTYPSNWREISRVVIAARDYRCERCHKSPPEIPWCTTHHIDGNPQNNHDDNLFVCCPKCHFFIDRYIYPRRPTPLSGNQLNLMEVK